MSIYKRTPYWWIKYEKDPVTGVIPRKPRSTGIYVDGGSKAQTAQNKADALLQFQADCIAIRKGELGPTAAPQKPTITLRTYVRTKWLPTRRVRGDEQEESNINILLNTYVPAVNGGELRKLGDFCLHELTAEVVLRWRAERLRTVKVGTVYRNVALLRVMLKTASAYLDANPLIGLDDMGNKRMPTLEGDDVDSRHFSREEFGRVVATIEAAESICDIPRAEGLALVYSAVSTLLRRSSLLKLTWSLYREDRYFVPLNPKVKGSIKRSPVSATMRQYLDDLPRDTPVIFESFYREARTATPVVKQQQLMAARVVQKWFLKVCARAHVPVTRALDGVTFHSFRHTGATWLLASGVSVRTVMEIGGWKDANVFLNRYCHTNAAECDAAVDSLFGAPKPTFPRAVAAQR